MDRNKGRKKSSIPWNKGKLKILREIRFCICGCNNFFECKINSIKRYIKGHNPKNIIGKKRIPREIRTCKCGCGIKKEVKITDKWQFSHGHNLKLNNPNPKIPSGIRVCQCGCNVSFICKVNSTKKFIKGHNFLTIESKIKRLKKGRHSWNYGLTAQTDVRIKKGAEKNSLTKSKLIQEGKIRPTEFNNYKTGWFYSKKNKCFQWYNSSYELIAFQILESLLTVKLYKVNPFRINYEFNNQKHYYLVDLFIEYIDKQKQIIEIKANWALKYPQTHAKLKAGREFAKEHNMQFNVWTEKELFKKENNIL